jgi:hypothetical protein
VIGSPSLWAEFEYPVTIHPPSAVLSIEQRNIYKVLFSGREDGEDNKFV